MSVFGIGKELAEAAARQLARTGIKSAQELAEKVMPTVYQSGDRVLIENTTGALRNLGAKVPSLPGPGLMGTPNVPTARQLGQAPKPAWENVREIPAGARVTNELLPQPYQGPRPAGRFEEPRPNVRFPGPSSPTETARQVTALQPGPGEVGSMGSRLTFPAGTQGIGGTRIGGKTYGSTAEVGAASNYPRAGQSLAEFMEQRLSQRPELAGTPLFRGGSLSEYVAPVPAFRGGQGVPGGAAVSQGGPGGALVRSAAGEVVDELMIDPVYVREIMDKIPELRGISNAAGGVQTGDLGAIMSNPALRALVGAGGLSALAFGVDSMGPDRTGDTTAGTPPGLPELAPGVPLIRDNDGSVPGVAPGSVLSGPTPGSALPTGATTGGAQIDSSVREAIAQGSPAAAAVLRATEPMSPERYSNIADYYAAREAFARSEGPRRELMKYMEGQSSTIGSELSAWAQANPGLAYEYQRRQLANPMANQQSAEVGQGITPSTAVGTETPANAIGAAEANAQAGVNPTQGSMDMADTLRMQVNPTLERIPAYAQRMNWRQRAASGYPGLAAGAPIQYNN